MPVGGANAFCKGEGHVLVELGFEVRSMLPIVDVIRPSDFTWQWPRTFIEVGVRRGSDFEAELGQSERLVGEIVDSPHRLYRELQHPCSG